MGKSKSVSIYSSSLGQKLIVGLTGLFLCSFLIVHLAGNLLLFKNDSGAAFNAYSEGMSQNIFIRILEIVLLAGFILHIFFGLRVWLADRRARPERYAMSRASENSKFVSRIAFWTGSVVLVFLVIHMRSFWVPTRFGSPTDSMYRMVTSVFANSFYDVFYVIALVLLAYHLRHGFQSAFQTFGLRPAWQRPIEYVSVFFWLLIPIGFASMPLYFLWKHLTGGP